MSIKKTLRSVPITLAHQRETSLRRLSMAGPQRLFSKCLLISPLLLQEMEDLILKILTTPPKTKDRTLGRRARRILLRSCLVSSQRQPADSSKPRQTKCKFQNNPLTNPSYRKMLLRTISGTLTKCSSKLLLLGNSMLRSLPRSFTVVACLRSSLPWQTTNSF